LILGRDIYTDPLNSVRAWLAVLGAALTAFCTSGFMNAFGVFQEHYALNQLKDKSEFTIAWIGSLAMCLMFLGAAVSGILVDRTGPTVSQETVSHFGRPFKADRLRSCSAVAA